jgi:hypothetical protein
MVSTPGTDGSIQSVSKSVHTPEEVRSTLADIRQSIERRGLLIDRVALSVGVSPAYLQSCLSGKRSLAPSRLVIASREAGIEFTRVAAALGKIVGGTTQLRVSRAARAYNCSYCGSEIRRNDEYVRLEPSGLSNQAGAAHFCRSCSELARWLQRLPHRPRRAAEHMISTAMDDRQLPLAFARHVKPTYVQLVDITSTLAAKILANPAELFELSPPQFEELVVDRLSAMGLDARPVGGGTYRRDGGIDIIFTPPKTFPFPFIGAVQVKHRRDPSSKVGPQPLRELIGVMATNRFFAAGMIVTNTSFTPDAKDFASRNQSLLRLRDFHDLMRWVADNFLDDAAWRDLPTRIQLCEGISVDLI